MLFRSPPLPPRLPLCPHYPHPRPDIAVPPPHTLHRGYVAVLAILRRNFVRARRETQHISDVRRIDEMGVADRGADVALATRGADGFLAFVFKG